MERRTFLKNSGALAAGMAVFGTGTGAMAAKDAAGYEFGLKYAPHFGMFRHSAGEDLVDQLSFMAAEGFTALEDNDMKARLLEDQERISKKMTELNITMGVFVAHTIYWQQPNITSGDQAKRDEFLAEIEASVEVAKRVNARWMTVVPGHLDLRQDIGFQTAHVVESLKQASAILEPHGLVMVLEPLNFRDHPGLFLKKVPQAYEVCKAVDSPSCKILFDIYHQQITEGNLIPNIDLAWDEIAYFQVGDNPGRKEPTTGEINFANVFGHIREKGFTGIVGMEHGNSKPGEEGERAVIEAYKLVDGS
jgi:hydroxypyruvate isomerase